MGDFVSVGLDTSEFVGIDDNVGSNCNCSEEEEEPEDELSIVGNSVVSLSLKVGLGDNSKLVGADDDTGKAFPPFDAIPSFISAGIILSYLGYYEEVKPLMLLLSYKS